MQKTETFSHFNVDKYEEKIKTLLGENNDLRSCLKELQEELDKVLSSQPVEEDLLQQISDAQFNLPFDLLRESFEDTVRAKIEYLAKNITSLRSRLLDSRSDKIRELQQLVSEQDRLLEIVVSGMQNKHQESFLNLSQ